MRQPIHDMGANVGGYLTWWRRRRAHSFVQDQGNSICVCGPNEIRHPRMIFGDNVTSVNDVKLEILAGFIFRAFKNRKKLTNLNL